MISIPHRARAALAASVLVLSATAPPLAAASLSPASRGQSGDSQIGAGVRYARAVRDDAALRNLADKNGHKVHGLSAGALLAIHGERADFYEVSIPGGVPVWVYGRYVRPTEVEGVYELTGDSVNARPRAAGGTDNYPVGLLYKGDRVNAIRRNDPELELATDWLQVWSPETMRVWVRKADVRMVSADEDGALLWAAALEKLARTGATPPAAHRKNAETPQAAASGAEERALAQLVSAQALFEEQKSLERPDFAAVRAAFVEVGVIHPGGDAARRAEDRLETLGALEEISVVQSELQQVRQDHDRAVLERQADAWEKSRRKDPLGQRFDGRGVLERRQVAGQAPRYVLHFGNEDLCEVLCTSGRYDLDLFSGFDVGLSGSFLRTVEASAGRDMLPVMDSERIRILARR